MRIITVDDIKSLLQKVTIDVFFERLIERLSVDFKRWHKFEKIPRVASHFDHGVIELMPIVDQDYYAYKYVNGHPGNPEQGKLTVIALGMLADVATGYPMMLSAMTILTALRTAASSALAAKYLAREESKKFGMIGTGAQSEFQTIAHHVLFNFSHVYYYDIDPEAMIKFANNLAHKSFKLIACHSAEEVMQHADIITTATADKKHARVIRSAWLRPGMHINGIGGDCPGKTELSNKILAQAKIVVELPEQTLAEGELQNFDSEGIYAELWELVAGNKPGRINDKEITLFDSVGFALEDYSVLRLVNSLAEQYHIGYVLDMVPELENPKDLFGSLYHTEEQVL